ncbi:MAG TPA: PIG-L family deacetylase [Clostridiaceae bacterium]|nr:PIG-L family deacetylase [Clostridiaceae bacterium]
MLEKKLRVLAIGAHPDDCDIVMGGTAVKFANNGHAVKFVSVTNGNAGHYSLKGDELAKTRASEAAQVAKTAGIEYEILDADDGKLEETIEMREKIIALIRRYKPDLIFTHRPNDYHPDHRRTSILVQDSSYLVMVPNICPSVECIRYQPIILYMFDNFKKPYPFSPNIALSIDDVLDKKVQMLNCHKSQFYEWLPWVDNELDKVPSSDDDRIKWLRAKVESWGTNCANTCRQELLEVYGKEQGEKVKYAEAFELSEYGAVVTDEELKKYFPF